MATNWIKSEKVKEEGGTEWASLEKERKRKDLGTTKAEEPTTDWASLEREREKASQQLPVRKDLGTEKITIKFLGTKRLEFTLKMKSRLLTAMEIYGRKVDRPVSTFKFHYDGRRVRGEDSPLSLDMKNGDTIEVYKQQLGGCKDASDDDIQ